MVSKEGTERPEHESQTIHQLTDTFPQSSVVSYEQPWAGQEGVEWPGPLVPGLLSLMSICLLFPYSTLQDRRADPLKSIFAKLLGQQASDWLNQRGWQEKERSQDIHPLLSLLQMASPAIADDLYGCGPHHRLWQTSLCLPSPHFTSA